MLNYLIKKIIYIDTANKLAARIIDFKEIILLVQDVNCIDPAYIRSFIDLYVKDLLENETQEPFDFKLAKEFLLLVPEKNRQKALLMLFCIPNIREMMTWKTEELLIWTKLFHMQSSYEDNSFFRLGISTSSKVIYLLIPFENILL